ncbi:MAG: hypothetical protein LUF85_02190 [Bacteroides sp.]|nr:hypothetical protein [Bacteroides sp.]
MKNQEKKSGKTEISSPLHAAEERYMEDEQLELDELINIQGGLDPDDRQEYCGLGCYVGGLNSDGKDNSLEHAKDQ